MDSLVVAYLDSAAWLTEAPVVMTNGVLPYRKWHIDMGMHGSGVGSMVVGREQWDPPLPRSHDPDFPPSIRGTYAVLSYGHS